MTGAGEPEPVTPLLSTPLLSTVDSTHSNGVLPDRLTDDQRMNRSDFVGETIDSDENSDGLSGYKSSNDEYIPSGSEDDDVSTLTLIGRQMNGREFCLDDKGEVGFEVGQVFDNVDHFRKVLKDYVVQEGFKLLRIKNERTRVTCKCADDGCPWRIHASPMPDGVTYKVRTYNAMHTCLRNSKDNKEATAQWIVEKFEAELRRNPEISIENLAEVLRELYGVECNSLKLYRARRMARELFAGKYASSYDKLPSYAAMLKQHNPGTLVKLAYYDRSRAISGVRCKHAIAAISYERHNPEKYCHPYLTKEAYMRTYAENVNPMPDEKMWPNVDHDHVLPPLVKRMPGRPKKNRRREPHEGGRAKVGKERGLMFFGEALTFFW